MLVNDTIVDYRGKKLKIENFFHVHQQNWDKKLQHEKGQFQENPGLNSIRSNEKLKKNALWPSETGIVGDNI